MALLELKNIYFEVENQSILKDISLTVEKGEVVAFLGTPGSGKSTALKTIAGINIPTSGKILFEGKDVMNMNRKENIAYRGRCGFMFQNSALWANQDIYHNFLLPLQIHNPDLSPALCNKKINEICKIVGYDRSLNIRPADLSIGEQKRIGLGRALICEPEILFLDEPTESLDEDTRKLVAKILKNFIKEGNTVVFVSHDVEFINTFVCNKYYFDKGSIVDKIFREDEDWGVD
ncbi:MAG: ATP-binding cassette domain-containing protein [Treponema sp.]|nr:ATP-binding cassette domain-containing protein [Treponema sp.]